MALKPWHTVVTPREDLREGKPLDAAEFAVHLDQVRDGRAPAVYQNPEQFFARTYLTENITKMAAEVIRRLSGEKTETSAIFNLATQFGGGKTHTLTLLYHLAQHGAKSHRWPGVAQLIDKSGMKGVPKAATAVFIGTEFDSLTGRGGDDGTPLRRTPWGEIAYQLSGEAGLAVLAEHEAQFIAPAGDVIRRFLPQGKPSLILMDELMNYISRTRKSGVAAQLYNFLQNLAEEARGRSDLVLAVSVPASELEMTAEDQSDYERLKKLLDRLGKAVILSAEGETSEIIRRRLFEWDLSAMGQDGRVLLPREALQTCQDYTAWLNEHRQQVPEWFAVDHARETFAAAYPFHPTVLSVFERKWQALPRFQRTRGILRLLALWVSRAYQDGYKGAHRDALIGLGTAPLDDPLFRAALFEQLGETRLEAAVTTDIAGKKDAHALRLDEMAVEGLRKARLHRKAATTILFESNGGQARGEATLPEVRLGIGEPGGDIGHIETALEALSSACYYLQVERNRYRFSLHPNLNKLLADRRASIQTAKIEARVQGDIQKIFAAGAGFERIYFPERSSQIPDRPVLALVVLPPAQSLQNDKTLALIEAMTRSCGNSGRTFKSALIWAVADSADALHEEARKALAWEAIDEEKDELRLDDSQRRQLAENLKRAQADLKECVWRTYKNLILLGKDNTLRTVDLGLVHSSAAKTLSELYLNRLRQDGDVEEGVSPNFLMRNWPPAFTEWSTKAVRDAFFASPQFPRLLNAEGARSTIARGVSGGQLAYVGKTAKGDYQPFTYKETIGPSEVEISDEVYIIKGEVAEAYLKAKVAPPPVTISPATATATRAAGESAPAYAALAPVAPVLPATAAPAQPTLITPPPPATYTRLLWNGEVPFQKWMNFYQKVLARFVTGKGLKLTVKVEITPEGGLSAQKLEETRLALRELGLNDEVKAD